MTELTIIAIMLAALLLYRERAHDAERAKLLNRIQDPAVEIVRTAPDPSDEIKHVPLDDDESFWELRDTYRSRN